MTVDELFAERLEFWSDIQGHLQFMRDLVAGEHAQVVVELGARSGNSTIALLSGVEETGGLLYSVDVSLPQWPGEVWAHPYVTFIQGDDLTVRDQVPDCIDVLFVDTSHDYDQTLAELNLYGANARVILLHDTDLQHPWGVPPDPEYPVRQAMTEWATAIGRPFEERAGSYGMGVICR
jgi:cephalosporin hydroxylase